MRLHPTLIALVLMAHTPIWAQNEAATAFESLFGPKFREAKKTASKIDDVELAVELLGAAKQSTDQKALLEVLCDKAYEMGSTSPNGYDHAVGAMQLLAEHVPAKQADAYTKMIKLLERQYNLTKTADEKSIAGQFYLEGLLSAAQSSLNNEDVSAAVSYYGKARIVATRIKSDKLEEIKQKQVAAISLRATYTSLKQLRAKLEANPKDEASGRRLIEIYIAELDQPEQARKYTFLIADASLKANVSMTGKAIEELKEDEALTMAKWYYGYTPKAKPHVKPSLLTRSKAYYEQYLALHTENDLPRKTAELTVNKINTDLEKLATVAEAKAVTNPLAGKWIDLLKTMDPEKHTERGKWVKQGGKIGVLEESFLPGRIRVPVNPDGSYELSARFTRTSGRNMIGLQLPVGKEGQFAVVLSERNGAGVTIGEINGQLNNDSTNRDVPLANGRAHTVNILVKIKDEKVDIKVAIDGKGVTKWAGDIDALGMNEFFQVRDPKSIGLMTQRNILAFSSLKLKILDGQANPLTDEQTEQLAENRENQPDDPRRRFDPSNLSPEQRERLEQLQRRFGGQGGFGGNRGRGKGRGRN